MMDTTRRDVQEIDVARAELWQIMADGPNVLWSNAGRDVYLWNADRRVIENLSADGPATHQWSAFIRGDYVVWMDQRDTPGASEAAPNNPEVYLLHLPTRTLRRITNDPPERPAGQGYPSLAGDWVLWSDFRNAREPNPPRWFTDRMELWGYHIPTGITEPIVQGAIQLDLSHDYGDGVITANCRDYDGETGSSTQLRAAIEVLFPAVRDQ
ncbi:MAG: hypothetical protein U0269_25065 [Polyangiales bacterium]